ncbi:MAG: hypothetical protein LBS75_01175 [Synergistaceae bacterium]|nr:hypothetical protein [Synergistaceae bacterium]
MNLDTRATAKRLLTLMASMGAITCYGYALGGVGGYLVGQGRPFAAAAGVVSGSVLALAAVLIWKGYLSDLELLSQTTRNPDEPTENGSGDAS